MDENKKLTYQSIVKHEKRISYIFSFILPVILFVLIFFIIATTDVEPGNSDTLGIAMAVSSIYPITFFLIYIPRRSSTKKKNSSRSFFQKIGFERMIIRDEMLQKLHRHYIEFFLWCVAFSIVMSLIWATLLDHTEPPVSGEPLKIFYKIQLIIYGIPIVPGIMVYSYYLNKSPLRRYSDANLFYSIGCFKILRNFEDITEIENTRYVIAGIKYYDEYLRRNLKISINNIEKFYTKLILNASISDHVDIILSKLECVNMLALLNYLTNLLKSNDPSTISASSSKSIKSALPFILSIIASVIAGSIVIIFQYALKINS